MGLSPLRRAAVGAAVVGVATLAVLVAVVATIVSWSGDVDDDDEVEGPTTTASPTTEAITTLDALAAAAGCDELDLAEGTFVPVDGVDSGGCRRGDRNVAALHVAEDDEAQEWLLRYFEGSSSGVSTLDGCPGTSDAERRDALAYRIVVGPRWVVTTHDGSVAGDVAARLGGADAAFSPQPGPPVSYLPGGVVECEATGPPTPVTGG